MRLRREGYTFGGHAIQTTEVTAFGDGDAEVGVLALVRVGEKVGKGLRVFLKVGEALNGRSVGCRWRGCGGVMKAGNSGMVARQPQSLRLRGGARS